MNINQLIIANEIKKFEKNFIDTLNATELPLEIVSYIKQSQGKKLRPLLTILITKIFDKVDIFTYRAAVLIELIHFSSLLHDDVIDNAKFRRKKNTINSIYGDKTAILSGDYLFSFALKLASDYQYDSLINVIANAIKDLSLGELLELENSKNANFDEKKYFETVKLKTASLIASCFEIACLSSKNDKNKTEKIKEIGFNFGLLFQILDDIMDYVGKNTGKLIGIDIENNKITLPLILALNNMNPDEKKSFLLLWFDKKDKENIEKIINNVINFNGIKDSEEKARQLLMKIISDIKTHFPKNKYSEFLISTILNHCSSSNICIL